MIGQWSQSFYSARWFPFGFSTVSVDFSAGFMVCVPMGCSCTHIGSSPELHGLTCVQYHAADAAMGEYKVGQVPRAFNGSLAIVIMVVTTYNPLAAADQTRLQHIEAVLKQAAPRCSAAGHPAEAVRRCHPRLPVLEDPLVN